MSGEPRLVTIPFSHFCEKARWALERSTLRFVEDGHLPLLHWRASLRAGGGRTVPVLVADGVVYKDSTDILRLADQSGAGLATGDADVMALEDRFDRDLGPATRRLAYHLLFPHRATLVRWASCGVPAWEAAAIRVGFPLARAVMKRGMRIDDAGAARSRKKIDEVWALVDEKLAGGHTYLAGDAFTAADLTFASLAAPVLFPEEHPFGTRVADLPRALQDVRAELAARPAGQHALRMYREHRRPSSSPAAA